jgi:hypothetical protein
MAGITSIESIWNDTVTEETGNFTEMKKRVIAILRKQKKTEQEGCLHTCNKYEITK